MEACLVAGVIFEQSLTEAGYWLPKGNVFLLPDENSSRACRILNEVAVILQHANVNQYLATSGNNPTEIRRRLDALEIPNE